MNTSCLFLSFTFRARVSVCKYENKRFGANGIGDIDRYVFQIAHLRPPMYDRKNLNRKFMLCAISGYYYYWGLPTGDLCALNLGGGYTFEIGFCFGMYNVQRLVRSGIVH